MAKRPPRPRSAARRPATAKPPARRSAMSVREPEPAAEPVATVEESPFTPPVLVAGVGASAGGFEAFSQMLAGMPPNPGMAIVFVQHLSPSHQSALPQLLSSSTRMPVEEATDGVILQPNHVYVTPANMQLRLHGNALHLVRRPTDRTQYSPIDAFFRSLAENAESAAIGVLLSGNSSDGVAGLREIRAAGGTVLVQDPQTARFDPMPRAAVNAEVADLILNPQELGPALANLASQPRLDPGKRGESEDHILRRIFVILRNATAVDFSHYKQPTIRRRLQRRMVLLKVRDLEGYLRHLESTPAEVQSLYDDLLILVTRFFRDPETFEALADRVCPTIAADRPAESPIRIWVPGCATGEEAYSICMTLLEYLGESAGSTSIQIFGTDISDNAIDRARAGIYPEGITEDVSAHRLRRFFSRVEGGYQISKQVRDLCIFAHQDLARDPPFSKLDLIVCRNVLIYLDPVLHKKVMTVFHYSLRPGGFLMLGRAESIGPFVDLFQTQDKKARIFVRKPAIGRVDSDYPSTETIVGKVVPVPRALRSREGQGVQGEATRLLLSRYAPPGVLVDSDLHIVQARGHTGPFLELAPGDASLHLLKMAREGLLFGLRAAINEARRSSAAVRKEGLRIKANGKTMVTNLEVVPLGGNSDRHFLILFDRDEPKGSVKNKRAGSRRGKARGQSNHDEIRFSQLQQELAASREYLQSIIQDLEATNEELQSANEEILSSNEELQSTNEELDTAKEELQSTNEEINTVNEELHARNEELSRANSDLVNLLAGVQIAIVFLTADLRIRRFTPMAEKVLNLISTDVGRPISNIRPNIDCPDLEAMINEVIESVATKEREVRDNEGKWYLLRIRPYKDINNRIDGAVLVLLDIHVLRRQEEMLKEAKDLAEAVMETVREPLVVLETDLYVRNVNKAFCLTFGLDRGETLGRPMLELGDGQWNNSPLRTILEDLSSSDDSPGVEGLEVVQDFPGVGRKRMLVNAQRGPASADSGRPFILLAMEERPPS